MVKASGKLQASKDESALFASKDTSDPSNFVSVSRELAERSSRIGTEDSSQLIGTQGFDLEKLLTEAASRIGNVKDYDERAVCNKALLARPRTIYTQFSILIGKDLLN